VALTFRRRFELAWVFSKVVSNLQRRHVLKKPKKRHLRRNVVVLGSAVAAGVVVAGVVCGRHGRSRGASPGNGAGAPPDAPEVPTPAAEPDRADPPTGTDGPPDIEPPGPQ
jgi:hypothetical protein